MPSWCFSALSVIVATSMVWFSGASSSVAQEPDFSYRCVVVPSPSRFDQAPFLPESLADSYLGERFYVEFWVGDSRVASSGIVSAYTDMMYTEDAAICISIGHSSLFNLFVDGTCHRWSVDELGGSQLVGGVGVGGTWARVAAVEFIAVTPGLTRFELQPAQSESSAYASGLVAPAAIKYGTCAVVSREHGACCGLGTCDEDTTEEECVATGGAYLGDGLACATDPDADGVRGCDDTCPSSHAPAGVDASGRPLGDLDGDCDVDLKDHQILQENFSGPGGHNW